MVTDYSVKFGFSLLSSLRIRPNCYVAARRLEQILGGVQRTSSAIWIYINSNSVILIQGLLVRAKQKQHASESSNNLALRHHVTIDSQPLLPSKKHLLL
jgi:hypothetical protein